MDKRVMETMKYWVLAGIIVAGSWVRAEAQADWYGKEVRDVENVRDNRDVRLRRVEQYLAELAQDLAEEDEKGDVQMALEYFEQLLERPLNINKASRGDLERLLLLSDFQINSLLTYRAEHGDILSGTELSLLNGFNDYLVELLREFFVFETDAGQGRIKSSGNFFKDCYSTLLLKGNRVLEREEWYMPITQEELEKKPNSRYLGTPYYMQLKYKCEYLGRVQVGFTLENDAGERVLSPMKIPMGDFFSFHVAFRDLRIGKGKRGGHLGKGVSGKSMSKGGVQRKGVSSEGVPGEGVPEEDVLEEDVPEEDGVVRGSAGEYLGRKRGLEITNLILGDFSARFGQGLTLWNSFSLMSTSSPQGFYKRGAAIVPYTSSDENNFLRGAAVTIRKEMGEVRRGAELEMTAVFSYHALDANVNDLVYTSVLTGGLHNTFGSYKTRKSMYETIGGANVVVRFQKFKIGASWTSYGYNKENGRRVQEYNKFQMYNGTWGNFSTDFYAVLGRVRLFGEVALDYGGSFAALAGGLFNIDNLEVGVLARSYSKSYIAAHANAYSTISSCSNQTGVAVNAAYPLSRLFRLSGNIDFAYYPWVRFNIPESSSILKGFVKVEYLGEKINGYLRLADSYSSFGRANKVGLRGVLGWNVCRNLTIKVRGELVGMGVRKREVAKEHRVQEYEMEKSAGSEMPRMSGREMLGKSDYGMLGLSGKEVSETGGKGGQFGYDAAVDVDYKIWEGRLRVQARGAYFNTGGWDTRLYMYEADLPHSFTSQLLYGTGFRGYLLMRWNVLRWMDVYAKLDTVQYRKRGEDSQIPAPLSKIKLGVKMNF